MPIKREYAHEVPLGEFTRIHWDLLAQLERLLTNSTAELPGEGVVEVDVEDETGGHRSDSVEEARRDIAERATHPSQVTIWLWQGAVDEAGRHPFYFAVIMRVGEHFRSIARLKGVDRGVLLKLGEDVERVLDGWRKEQEEATRHKPPPTSSDHGRSSEDDHSPARDDELPSAAVLIWVRDHAGTLIMTVIGTVIAGWILWRLGFAG